MTGFSIEHVDFANVHRDFALKIQGDFPAVMDFFPTKGLISTLRLSRDSVSNWVGACRKVTVGQFPNLAAMKLDDPMIQDSWP